MRKTLGSSYTALNCRFYVAFNALPTAAGVANVELSTMRNSVSGVIALIGLTYTGTGWKWFIIKSGGTINRGPEFIGTDGSYYCLEYRVVTDAVNGEMRLYANGIQQVALTNENTGTNAINQVDVRLYHDQAFLAGIASFFDCYVVSDEYIGPEFPMTSVISGVGRWT